MRAANLRLLATLFLLLPLTGCGTWNWRATGHEILRSLCYQAENCAAD